VKVQNILTLEFFLNFFFLFLFSPETKKNEKRGGKIKKKNIDFTPLACVLVVVVVF